MLEGKRIAVPGIANQIHTLVVRLAPRSLMEKQNR